MSQCPVDECQVSVEVDSKLVVGEIQWGMLYVSL